MPLRGSDAPEAFAKNKYENYISFRNHVFEPRVHFRLASQKQDACMVLDECPAIYMRCLFLPFQNGNISKCVFQIATTNNVQAENRRYEGKF